MNKPKALLLIKGYGESHEDRWQHHEKHIAEELGIRVVYPQEIHGLQGGEVPTRADVRQNMFDILERESIEPEGLLTMPHSIGGNVWAEILRTREEFRDSQTIFIATPWDRLSKYSDLDDFLPETPVPLTVEQRRNILVVGSGDDPIIEEHPKVFADNMGTDHVVTMGAGHYMPHCMYLGNSKPPRVKPPFKDLGVEWPEIRAQIRMPY